MNCEYSRVRISLLLDRELGERERRETLAHLESCGSCREEYHALDNQRVALRSMEALPVPAVLTHRLRVLASHERVHRMARASLSARLRHVADNVRLFMDNMMRPVALPVGGGLLSAMLLFGMLAPGLVFSRNADFDPSIVSLVTLPEGRLFDAPTGLPEGRLSGTSGEVVSVQMAGFVSLESGGLIPASSDSTLVELTLDRYGHVLDWKMLQGELTPEVKSVIVYSTFNPGTYFGVPTDSKILVSLRPAHSAARS
ncbi:MAG TPA: zf-HC2 domain-containing protein [Isosphaeraceae bacterium]|nr:zf-HC2 domain-containing protein [Isosphaeraceae bacterium]